MKYVTELTRKLEDAGINVEVVEETSGGHFRMRLAKGGERRIMFISGTPSCRRAGKNALSTAKRLFNQGG